VVPLGVSSSALEISSRDVRGVNAYLLYTLADVLEGTTVRAGEGPTRGFRLRVREGSRG
jgi:hypothetical protein